MAKTGFRPTTINIDLDALSFNINNIKKLIGKTKLSIAVKSNAYGHGIIEISKHLETLGIDMLLVSSADEAIKLRNNDIALPILILSEVTKNAIAECVEHDISFTAYTQKFIEGIKVCSTDKKPAKLHLKVNTGMNRVGCEINDVIKLASNIEQSSNLVFEGIFTHFATADETDTHGFEKQNTLFDSVLKEISQFELSPKMIHACNSAATIKFPQAHHSMVRVGLSAYGIYPNVDMRELIDLKPILTLKSEISYIKNVEAHEKISYGWHHEFLNSTRVATIPIGYGDGVSRNLGMNGGSVLIAGKRCKILGAVTMDQLMVDIGDLNVQSGDEVILIGKEITVEEWANIADSITWEVLCSFSARLPRIYD